MDRMGAVSSTGPSSNRTPVGVTIKPSQPALECVQPLDQVVGDVVGLPGLGRPDLGGHHIERREQAPALPNANYTLLDGECVRVGDRSIETLQVISGDPCREVCRELRTSLAGRISDQAAKMTLMLRFPKDGVGLTVKQ